MKTRPQVIFSIPIGRPLQRERNPAKGFRRLCGILALAIICHAVDGATARQAATAPSRSAQSSKTPSPFQAAENLLSQGQIAAAREEIQEQLKAHPTSVVGYNLLGITYSDEKNYAAALEAFQQALKLDPRSTVH